MRPNRSASVLPTRVLGSLTWGLASEDTADKKYDLTAGEGARVWEDCLRVAADLKPAETPQPRQVTDKHHAVETRMNLSEGLYEQLIESASSEASKANEATGCLTLERGEKFFIQGRR